jgi:hypothetical protein
MVEEFVGNKSVLRFLKAYLQVFFFSIMCFFLQHVLFYLLYGICSSLVEYIKRPSLAVHKKGKRQESMAYLASV